MLPFFRARNSGGRHAQQQAPAAPHDSLAAPAPALRSDPGGGGRLTDDRAAELAEMRGIHERLLAEILLNAGDDFKDAGEAPEYSAEAYVRWLESEVGRLKAHPRWRFTTPSPEVAGQVAELYGGGAEVTAEPKAGRPATRQTAQEQVAAYRHTAGSGEQVPSDSPPDADDGERM